jgi:dTMP kinase
MTLFYATDFADRMVHQIIPALKAGFVVLADRYVYTLIARALVRGIEPDWIRKVYGFALKPENVFYLRASVDDLVTRVLQRGSFDYWESGMDLHLGDDMYESFVEYQKRIMGRFDKMVEDYGFRVIDASRSIEEIFTDLKDQMSEILNLGREAPSDPITGMKTSRNGRATQEIARNERREIDLRYIGYGRPDNGAALGRD